MGIKRYELSEAQWMAPNRLWVSDFTYLDLVGLRLRRLRDRRLCSADRWLVDRAGARRLLSFFLLPLAVGVGVLGTQGDEAVIPVFMALSALTSGCSSTLLAVFWVELFGARHLGAIRSVAFSAQVLASALAPGLIGVLLDIGVAMERQLLGLAVLVIICAVLLAIAGPRLYAQTRRHP